jgi:hypothetical protein
MVTGWMTGMRAMRASPRREPAIGGVSIELPPATRWSGPAGFGSVAR